MLQVGRFQFLGTPIGFALLFSVLYFTLQLQRFQLTTCAYRALHLIILIPCRGNRLRT